ncbi:MAG: MliC family protein [Sphingomonadaceae bacterium]|nr:MliC family protein [Sphingomonadaceae bacterium]
MIEVLYGAEVAVVTINGEPIQMKLAPSADGARYSGGGWQWWGKGERDGLLSSLMIGEKVASAPGISCHAS